MNSSATMQRLEGLMVRSTLTIALLGLLSLLALATIVLANALMSKLFGQPIDGVIDWIRVIVANTVSACLPAVLATRTNITIKFIGHLAGKQATRWLELLGGAITWLAFAVLTWQMQVYVLELIASGETTENLEMPIWPWWQSVAILFSISLIVQTYVVFVLVDAIIRRQDLPKFAPATVNSPDESH